MTIYVGETMSEVFGATSPGETFTRAASYINGAAVVWDPSFTDLGGGNYRYAYTTTAAGAHEWIGAGTTSGLIAINFDVDEAGSAPAPPPAAAATTAIVTTPTELATLPVCFDLPIYQSEDQTVLFRLTTLSEPRAPFQPSSLYTTGDFVTKSVDDGTVFLVVDPGTSGGSEPTWPEAMGERVTSFGATFMLVGSERLVDTTTYDARWKVREEPAGTVVAAGSNAEGRAEVGYDPPSRANATAYGLGQQVVPVTLNGWRYTCEDAGTSGGSAPIWPTVHGQTVTDGTVTWRAVRDDTEVSNLRIVLDHDYTAGLDFDVGLFALDLIDPFGKRTTVFSGTSWLIRKVAEA